MIVTLPERAPELFNDPPCRVMLPERVPPAEFSNSPSAFTVMLPGKDLPSFKMNVAFAVTSMLWTSLQEEISLLLT